MPKKGWKHSEETRKRLSLLHKRLGTKPPNQTGKHWNLSEETKEKMSRSSKGKPRYNQRGEKNSRWKGGVSKKNKGERQLAMETIEYKNWRRAVFERDNYICQKCEDNVGGNLEADHIKPWSTHPKLRYVVSNGRTLCKDCHKKITAAFNSLRQTK